MRHSGIMIFNFKTLKGTSEMDTVKFSSSLHIPHHELMMSSYELTLGQHELMMSFCVIGAIKYNAFGFNIL